MAELLIKTRPKLTWLLLCQAFWFAGCSGASGLKSPGIERQHLSQQKVDSIDVLSGSFGSLESLTEEDLKSLPKVELKKLLSQLQSRNESEKKELSELRSINRAFCQRLRELESSCVASLDLLGKTTGKDLKCDDEDFEAEPIEFTVDLQGVDGRYRIVANRSIESDIFSTGSHTIEFKGQKGQPSRAIDMTSWRLVALNGRTPDLNGLQFSLKINGEILFGDADLLHSLEDNANFLRLNPLRIADLRQSDSCRVSKKELREIRAEARGGS